MRPEKSEGPFKLPQPLQSYFLRGYRPYRCDEADSICMDNADEYLDPTDFLASLERRHEEVLLEIDQLADRIEKTLLEYKLPSRSVVSEKALSVDKSSV